jgi:hypothetical protein
MWHVGHTRDVDANNGIAGMVALSIAKPNSPIFTSGSGKVEPQQ